MPEIEIPPTDSLFSDSPFYHRQHRESKEFCFKINKVKFIVCRSLLFLGTVLFKIVIILIILVINKFCAKQKSLIPKDTHSVNPLPSPF